MSQTTPYSRQRLDDWVERYKLMEEFNNAAMRLGVSPATLMKLSPKLSSMMHGQYRKGQKVERCNKQRDVV